MKKPQDLWGSCPTRSRKTGFLLQSFWKGGQQEAFMKDSGLMQKARGSTLGQTTPILTMRFCTICLIHFGRWWILQAFSNKISTKFRTHGLGRKNSMPPIMPPRPHRGIYSSSAWRCQQNHQASWGYRGFFPWKPFTGGVATHVAHGVLKRGKTKEPWLTSSIQSILPRPCVHLCLAFFTTSVVTMRKHGLHCKARATRDQEEEEVSEDNNGDKDDGYLP